MGFAGKFLPVYGLDASYAASPNSTINLRLNWLEPSEDNPNFAFRLPVSFGIEGRFSSQGPYGCPPDTGEGIGLEYIWDPLKSHLPSTRESEITHHWLKGYIGDKFRF